MALRMGGEARIQDQHDRGKLTVRERIDALIDPGSLRERMTLAGSAFTKASGRLWPRNVFGLARLDGRPVVSAAMTPRAACQRRPACAARRGYAGGAASGP
jgi:acetyl-CoA carboxylase carboxyltransferase component